MPKHRYTTDERFERHVVLVSPEIHWNTGNVGRTCLAVNAFLHLIKPLGFSLHARELKRAGLDYWHRVKLHIWDDFDQFETALAPGPDEIVLLTKKGRSPFWSMPSPRRLFLIFGSETKGLPKSILFRYKEFTYHIPTTQETRSLNLSTAVGIALYESMRHFPINNFWVRQ
jgi:tRNA (cytidine/uridine-2'-O-)-methyltransferase